MPFPKFGLVPWLLLGATPVIAQINAGTLPPTPSPPFNLTKVAQFDLPWRIAFLPDGRMLITEKIGKLFLATESGQKLEVTGVPPVLHEGQNGLLGVYLAPAYSSNGAMYLTYSEPGQEPEKWLAWLGQSHPDDVAIAKRYDARVVDNPLTQSFYSQVPYAFGLGDDTICRYGALPHPENKNAGPPPVANDGNYLRQVMIDRLTTAAQPATFDFCVQLQTGATPEIIDSPTAEWSAPYQRVATITVMAQDFAQPDQDRFGQNLSYTPWHALPEHRPVGQINEIRRMVYAWSSGVRHLFNLRIQREPTSAIPPRPTSGCLGRVVKYTALAAAVSIAVIGAFLWPKLHVDLPEYPAVEKQVWLEQQWQPGGGARARRTLRSGRRYAASAGAHRA